MKFNNFYKQLPPLQHMKKTCALAILSLLLFSISLTVAADNETTEQSDSDKIQNGFDCLEEKAGDCSTLTTQETALTILATPDNIFDDCVQELENRQESDNWGNVRDTALAILALKHAGKDTEPAEDWILEQEQIPTELIWYMQQDSNTKTECHISYDANGYTINVEENKKIDSNAGQCLSLAQSNFWLQIAPACYNKEFTIECDQDFIANLLYKNKKSPTIHIPKGTDSSPAFGTIELNVQSKCFGATSCDYEATIWATLALLKTGHNVEKFIPYIIAMSDTNERYLPEAFVYMLTNNEDYATQLIANQKLGNYWEAKSSAYNKFYDTSIVLIALGSSSSEQITKARDWLLFSQGSNGCWQNSAKETAITLWALAGRSGRTPAGNGSSSSSGSGVTYCSEAGYFCIPSFDCPSSEDVGNNYFCPSLSDTCCTTENLKTCSDYGGEKCTTEEVCIGNERKTSDITRCCTGTCQDRPQETECESNLYTCMDSCSEFQEPMPAYSCDQAQVCCRIKTTTEETSSAWWIWILVILILATLVAIGYVYREKLKLLWFQLKTKFKKDEGKGGGAPRGPHSGIPPRPGFPPIRRVQQKRPPQARSYDRRDKSMFDTFKKLRDMSS